MYERSEYRQMIEQAHAVAHRLEHNQDETITVAVTRQEATMLVTALGLHQLTFPCFYENVREFVQKLTEVGQAQQPEWEEVNQ